MAEQTDPSPRCALPCSPPQRGFAARLSASGVRPFLSTGVRAVAALRDPGSWTVPVFRLTFLLLIYHLRHPG